MHSSLIQKRSVAAAEINQPKLANILQMNQRVPARHFWRLQHNCASTGSSYGTTAFDRMAFAIGCFEPGTFIWGHTHTEALSNVTADGKYLPSDERTTRSHDHRRPRRPRQGRHRRALVQRS